MKLLKKRKEVPTKKLILADRRAPFVYIEAYKTLRTNLDFIIATNTCKKIVITSTAPDEQKSNVCINLSLTLAAAGHKVCLLDCDLRKPTHHKLLRLGMRVVGLTGILSGKTKLSDALFKVKDIGIYSLPCGPIPPNSTELISSLKMKEVLGKLEQEFDYLIIDSPPASIVSDAMILGNLADGMIFVVKYDYMDKKVIKKTKEKLEQSGIHMLGTILSGFDMDKTYQKGNYYYYGNEDEDGVEND